MLAADGSVRKPLLRQEAKCCKTVRAADFTKHIQIPAEPRKALKVIILHVAFGCTYMYIYIHICICVYTGGVRERERERESESESAFRRLPGFVEINGAGAVFRGSLMISGPLAVIITFSLTSKILTHHLTHFLRSRDPPDLADICYHVPICLSGTQSPIHR